MSFNYYVAQVVKMGFSPIIKHATTDFTTASTICRDLAKQYPNKTFVILRQACRDCDDDSTRK